MDAERLSDTELIEQTRAGDAGAFAALCFRYEALLRSRVGPRIAGAVRRFAGTKKRDVGQEVTRGARKDTADFQGRSPTPSEVAQAEERREQIQLALGNLPPDYRRVLQLIQVDGLTVDAAAALLGRSRQATKKLYARALARLADEIDL